MSRYKDADKLIELCEMMADKCDGIGESVWNQFATTVDWSPTVDAVPVVRCKDCKWLDYCDTQEGKEYLCCREGFPVDLNDFCSWGEKVSE